MTGHTLFTSRKEEIIKSYYTFLYKKSLMGHLSYITQIKQTAYTNNY